MPTEILREQNERFDQPWCKALLDDPSIRKWKLINRRPPPPYDKGVDNRFFGLTLFTDSAVRAYRPMYRAGSGAIHPTDPAESIIMLSVGDGIDGANGRLHGGFTSTLLDQASGVAMNMAFPGWFATAELHVKFKKPVPTPALLLVKAHVVKEEGRRVHCVAEVTDGKELVYATAEAIQVKLKMPKNVPTSKI